MHMVGAEAQVMKFIESLSLNWMLDAFIYFSHLVHYMPVRGMKYENPSLPFIRIASLNLLSYCHWKRKNMTVYIHTDSHQLLNCVHLFNGHKKESIVVVRHSNDEHKIFSWISNDWSSSWCAMLTRIPCNVMKTQYQQFQYRVMRTREEMENSSIHLTLFDSLREILLSNSQKSNKWKMSELEIVNVYLYFSMHSYSISLMASYCFGTFANICENAIPRLEGSSSNEKRTFESIL